MSHNLQVVLESNNPSDVHRALRGLIDGGLNEYIEAYNLRINVFKLYAVGLGDKNKMMEMLKECRKDGQG